MSGQNYDFVIIGGGLYGCAIAYHLVHQGAENVVVLERSELGSGATAKSCAIIRTHYSVQINLLHAVESLKIFSNFNELVGGDVGFRQTGYLILGPQTHKKPMEEVFRTQNEHGIDTDTLTSEQAGELHPLLNFDDVDVIGFDSHAGYADPHLTTTSYASRASDLGATFLTNTAVTGFKVKGNTKIIETIKGEFESPTVIIAAGPWTQRLGQMIGIQCPYVISRHKVVTLRTEETYRSDWPIVKDLTTPDKIYFRPETGGVVLVGTGDHGDPIEDPDRLNDYIEREHVERIDRLISNRMPVFNEGQYVTGWTGPYDITPDWNPVVGEVPDYEGVYIAVGFSGHGFKLAPTISESLAQTVLGKEARIPIDAYSMSRFEIGNELHGAYGIGSIS